MDKVSKDIVDVPISLALVAKKKTSISITIPAAILRLRFKNLSNKWSGLFFILLISTSDITLKMDYFTKHRGDQMISIDSVR